MVIDIANFNFDGGSGGGGKPALLQEKTATIVQNGSQTITPDEGFDGMSSVQINAAITGASSAIDFSSIGYSDEFSAEVNAKFNADVAYSKTLYDSWNPSNTSAAYLYSGDKKLVYAPNIDTSNVTKMQHMLDDCSNITSVPSFNTSKVTNMSDMFNGCSNLTSVPELNTSNVTDMSFMFTSCSSITSVPELNTSKVTSMGSMFNGCSNLTSVPSFNTSNVTSMSNMLRGCSKLTSVPSFNTSNVTSMSDMFFGCNNLALVPSFNTSKVTNMSNMFYYCSSITSVPAFDTRNVTNFNGMFTKCEKLTTIEGISFKSFTDSTMSYDYIFGYSKNSSIRKAVFKDIGYQSNAQQFNTSYATNWGVNSDEITDARQSLIDSLITYSFDRATAGYPTCTITLSTNTKALLTEDEIAQITAKGFTIA